MSLEEEIKDKLGTRTFIKQTGNFGGCISSGCVYKADNDQLLFVKQNDRELSALMFEGELESLTALYATNTVRVPKPMCNILNYINTKSALVIEFIPELGKLSKHQAQLGEKLGQLHLHNETLGKKLKKERDWVGKGRDESGSYITEFGFHCPTSCGYYPMINEWNEDWVIFYARNRLEEKIKSIFEDDSDRQLNELWSELQLKLSRFFSDIETPIVPALLHGDLWAGNAAETSTEAVMYDPASFYGHSEFDLAICNIFGGFNKDFFNSYHSVVKKARNYSPRSDLYQLFHLLNHWQHFGGGYKSQSLNLMKKLCKMQI